jgi:hypothetical protein
VRTEFHSGADLPVSEQLSLKRRIAFSVILVLIVLVLIEALSQLAYQIIYDHHYHPRRLKRLTSDAWVLGENAEGLPDYMRGLIVHPYFGFGLDATGEGKAAFGLAQRVPPTASLHESNKLRILVLGGSVAMQLMQPDDLAGPTPVSFLEAALQRALQEHAIERRVWLYNAAIPGGKQPQQLMAYTFLLSLGAEFDLVLNLDGFNEMTLAMFESRPKGLHPVYPRGWEIMLGSRLTSQKLRALGRLIKVREQQAGLIDFAESSPFARPTLVGLLLAQRIVDNERRAAALLLEIEKERQVGELTLEEGGVPFDYEDADSAYSYLAALWRRSSVALGAAAAATETEYLHVFQPNQYLEGSKVLTAEEQSKFYLPQGEFGVHYRGAYPFFVDEMPRLAEFGVHFVNASMLFKDEQRTVYVDACCHFNEYGIRALADFVAREVVKSAGFSAR